MKRQLYLLLLLATIFGCSKTGTTSVTPNSGSQSPITIYFDNNAILKPTTFKNIVDDPNSPDYIVTYTMQVNEALTIEAGVVIQFVGNIRGIQIGEKGAIIAKGTSANHIRMIGTKSQKGSWGSIAFYGSLDPRNEFDFVDFMYGGGDSNKGMLNTDDGLDQKSLIKITNCLFKGSLQYGLVVQGGLSTFSNNVFQENELAPVLIHRFYVHFLDTQSIYTGNNGIDAIEIKLRIETDDFLLQPVTEKEVTWKTPADGTKYLISDFLPIKFGLRISPGARLDFKPGSCLLITRDGYLIAKGTQQSKIKFLGATQTAGGWGGIWIASNNSNNEISYAEISHAGQKPQKNQGEFSFTFLTVSNFGAIMLNGINSTYYQPYGAKLKLSNSVISQSSTYGVVIGKSATLEKNNPDDNLFTNCQSGNAKSE